MKRLKSILFLSIAVLALNTVPLNASDSTRTSPLNIYSGGIGVGAVKTLNEKLSKEHSSFLKVSFLNRIFFTDNLNLICDINWFIPGQNFGGDFGIHYNFTTSRFKPFFGIGAGTHYIERSNQSFGENIGLSGTIHGGFLLEVSETFHVELMVPYHLVGNKEIDHAVGFQIGFIFLDKYSKVRKLHL